MNLCKKWKVKLILPGPWNRLMAWTDWLRSSQDRSMPLTGKSLKVVCQVLVVVRDLVVLAPLLTSLENSQNTARKSTRSRLAYVRRPHELSLWPLDFTLSYNTGSSVPNSNRFCLQFVNHKRPKLVRTRNGELSYSMPRALSVAGSPGSETRHPLICRVYNRSLVYSLVVLDRIKYHPECIKSRHFQIKNK